MSPTDARNKACKLAATDNGAALKIAVKIADPWYRAQALAAVARSCPKHRAPDIANLSIKAAAQTRDDYQSATVRAWIVEALIAQGFDQIAAQELHKARAIALTAEPIGSRAEALIRLMQASIPLGRQPIRTFTEDLARIEQLCDHWRVCRALVDALVWMRDDDSALAQMLADKIHHPRTRRRALAQLATNNGPHQ